MKDGDLWEAFTNIVLRRGPETVTLTKVKGHATDEMVAEGKVALSEKLGNDRADVAADKGATATQQTVQEFGSMYCSRHKRYRQWMCRVQRFIVGLKAEERRLKQEKKRAKDPFEAEADTVSYTHLTLPTKRIV